MPDGDLNVQVAHMRAELHHSRTQLDEARRDIRDIQDRVWQLDAQDLRRSINWTMILAVIAILIAGAALLAPRNGSAGPSSQGATDARP